MKRSKGLRLALVCFLALLPVVGCSDDDDPFDVPVEEAVENGLDEALTTTVVPMVTFMGTLGDLLSNPFARAPEGLACPSTNGWCSSGNAVCTQNLNGFDFDFNACQVDQVVTGGDPLKLDGDVTVVPGSTIGLTITNLSINDGPATSGIGSIDTEACDYTVTVSTDDATVTGLVTICDEDDFPTADTLGIGFSDFQVLIVFNGTNTVPATATQNGLPVADCTINLVTFTSSCVATD